MSPSMTWEADGGDKDVGPGCATWTLFRGFSNSPTRTRMRFDSYDSALKIHSIVESAYQLGWRAGAQETVDTLRDAIEKIDQVV